MANTAGGNGGGEEVMKRILSAAAAWLVLAVPAWAQTGYVRPQTNPYGIPTVSPYVNLNRFAGNPGLNYFGIVRPELQANANLAQLQQQTAALYDQQALANIPGADPNQPATGHTSRFFNYSHYYASQGGHVVAPPLTGSGPGMSPLMFAPKGRNMNAAPPQVLGRQ
jgi:hypothetical protein